MSFILSVAPMMDCTDRHDRYFLRLIAPNVRLYTEMITAQALKYGDTKRLLQFHPHEKYLALQLGGSDPQSLREAAKMGEASGYDEINLNVGCPSKRVKAGKFGAVLMKEVDPLRAAIGIMVDSVSIPVTVKCRIGVDECDSYDFLYQFIEKISGIGVQQFIIHARKAWLSGLSPKENRTIPPLDYERVWAIKRDFPQLSIVMNGGIQSLPHVLRQEGHVDGVMIGRSAYHNPYLLSELETHYFGTKVLSREEVIENYLSYVSEQLQNKVKLSAITRHLFGLYHGQPKARHWRRFLSENCYQADAGSQVLKQAIEEMQHDERNP